MTPTAVSIAGPQPPAKQVCDIMPLVPPRGPREQAGGREQGRRWRRKQREVRSLPDKLIDNVWETSPQVGGKLPLMSPGDHGPKSGAGR